MCGDKLRFFVSGLLLFLSMFSVSVTGGALHNIDVVIPTGKKQCENNDDYQSIKQVRNKLAKEGVEIISSSCAIENKFYVTVCGAPEGDIYVFEIDSRGRDQALELGFIESYDLTDGFTVVDCK